MYVRSMASLIHRYIAAEKTEMNLQGGYNTNMKCYIQRTIHHSTTLHSGASP